MLIERLVIVGAGGHAKVVLDALARASVAVRRVDLVDQQTARQGAELMGHVVGPMPVEADLHGAHFHLAIGDCQARARLHAALSTRGGLPWTIVHPAACVGRGAELGSGSFVAAQAVVGPDTALGDGCIVNHGSVVDHDCRIGDFSHIAPRATLCGGVQIGSGVLVGAGATILPGVSVGDGAVIAAGTTVLRDVAAGETFIPKVFRRIGTNAQ